MLRTLLLVTFMFWYSLSQAQFIQNISVIPAYPGPMDSVKVLVGLQFSSGSCEMSSQNYSVNNDSVRIEVTHCPGPLGFICDVTDTINLGLLSVGTYNTAIILRRGIWASPDPCAGSSPADSAGVRIIVYGSSGLDNMNDVTNHLYFERESQSIILDDKTKPGFAFILYNSQGAIVFKSDAIYSNRFRIPQLSEGVYLYALRHEDGTTQSGKLSVN